ncbi:pirin family protein [Marinilabiliaceae bacterium JC017]|nr:pirin family protein [Marinilabiliaceae bacterium JC017]
MKAKLHKAGTRGHTNYGWLDSYHSFSFADYYNPERIHFGALRILNDDTVAPGKGFGKHSHDNMEIVSIVLEGELEHKDSMGNELVIREGEVQVTSAGSGIFHSEYNRSKESDVKFLQVWIIPNEKNVEPRHDRILVSKIAQEEGIQMIISPNSDDQVMWLYQEAWFYIGHLKQETAITYPLKDRKHGVYLFVIEGQVKIDGQVLERRDGYGMWDLEEVIVWAVSDAHILLMEVPMLINEDN